MKRFVFVFIIVVLCAQAVFLVGWVPLRLKPGSYAVLITKTGGVAPAVLRPGSFYWKAECLLPTNAKIITFTPFVCHDDIHVSGELPSAAVYKEFMAGQPDFTYAIEARMSAAVKPDSLPEIVSRWGIDTDEKLSEWLKGEMQQAANDVRLWLQNTAAEMPDETAVLAYAANKYPHIDISAFQFVSVKRPDPKLYAEAQALYRAYMTQYRETIEPLVKQASQQALYDQMRLETLKRYGELLTQFPILIDYLAVEAGIAPRSGNEK